MIFMENYYTLNASVDWYWSKYISEEYRWLKNNILDAWLYGISGIIAALVSFSAVYILSVAYIAEHLHASSETFYHQPNGGI